MGLVETNMSKKVSKGRGVRTYIAFIIYMRPVTETKKS